MDWTSSRDLSQPEFFRVQIHFPKWQPKLEAGFLLNDPPWTRSLEGAAAPPWLFPQPGGAPQYPDGQGRCPRQHHRLPRWEDAQVLFSTTPSPAPQGLWVSCQAQGRQAAAPGAEPPAKTPPGVGAPGSVWAVGELGRFLLGRRGEVRRSGSLISASQSHGLIVCQDERVRWKGWSCSKSPLQSLPRAWGHPRRCQSGGAGRQRSGAAVWGGPGGAATGWAGSRTPPGGFI